MWSKKNIIPAAKFGPVIRTLPPKRINGYIIGPALFDDGPATSRASPRTESRDEYSPPPTQADSLTFSPAPSHRSTKSKKSIMSSRCKKDKCICEFSAEECPRRREEAEAELRREKSDYENRKRAKIIEMAKQAEQDHEKLLVQRARAEQAAKELESSLGIEQEARNRSLDTMKSQLEGIESRGSRDLKDLRREIDQWKGKTAKSGELAKRVDVVEKRVGELEKAYTERKATMEMVEKNWADFGRLKTQSMALEITQIKNRRGAMHLERMPKDVAQTTAKNMYRLIDDLQRLNLHLNQKTDLTRLVDEALTLAEAIAPLYGVKEDFLDSRENTSSTNVSLSAAPTTVSSASSADNSSTSSGGSVPTSPSTKITAPIRASLRRAHKDPAGVSIPPSKFDPKFKSKENLHIDAPSLREKSSNYYSNYYSDNELTPKASKEAVLVIPPAEPTVAAADTPAPVAAAPAAAPPLDQQQPAAAAPAAPPTAPEPPVAAPIEAPAATPTPAAEPPIVPAAPAAAAEAVPDQSPASISLSIDSDRPAIKEQKKKSSRRSTKERKEEESKPE